ncbi:Cof-type HAD-IIB family hydrolase [Lacticaseibacillus baoqingensis]|uniref:Cof-type HAD-IIB family hydrolase n=1 Tax=Lacticaseibacillus baoqingensis TaxID=2486013 RepID=A0ABW4E893_9LACO|nr:Cof-type HAD-IIB family hydrolase [Lacticaseibacillus baoqingensis]
MVKAVALFDLDKTLLNDDKVIPPENVAALHALRANGVLPALATGRNHYELGAIMAAGGLDSAIEANGAAVFFAGQQVLQHPLPPAQVAALVAQTEQDGFAIAFHNETQAALTRQTPATQAHYRDFIHKPQPAVVPDFYVHQPVLMIVLYIPDTPANAAVVARYRQQFPQLAIYRNAPAGLDVVSAQVNKATGLEALMAQPQLHGLPTYAFGDGNNDMEIIQQATVGIAMGNALPQVAAVADYQTADYQHGGIMQALAHFHLL